MSGGGAKRQLTTQDSVFNVHLAECPSSATLEQALKANGFQSKEATQITITYSAYIKDEDIDMNALTDDMQTDDGLPLIVEHIAEENEWPENSAKSQQIQQILQRLCATHANTNANVNSMSKNNSLNLQALSENQETDSFLENSPSFQEEEEVGNNHNNQNSLVVVEDPQEFNYQGSIYDTEDAMELKEQRSSASTNSLKNRHGLRLDDVSISGGKKSEQIKRKKSLKKKNAIPPEQRMPKYISRAFWHRSDDENLEILIDTAIRQVLGMSAWKNRKFVRDIYNDNTFKDAVDVIFGENEKFFEDFVRNRFQRELEIYEIMQERNKPKAKNKNKSKNKNKATATQVNNEKIQDSANVKVRKYRVFVCLDLGAEEEEKKDNNSNSNANVGITKTRVKKRQKSLKQSRFLTNEDLLCLKYYIVPTELSEQTIPENFSVIRKFDLDVPEVDENDEHVWAVWKSFKKKKMRHWLTQAQRNSIQITTKYWDILSAEAVLKIELKKPSKLVSIAHLNIIFALLRYYYALHIFHDKKKEFENDRSPIKHHFFVPNASSLAPAPATAPNSGDAREPHSHHHHQAQGAAAVANLALPVYDLYVNNSNQRRIAIQIEDQRYRLDWWNRKGRHECNAFIIKDLTDPAPFKRESVEVLILAEPMDYEEQTRITKPITAAQGAHIRQKLRATIATYFERRRPSIRSIAIKEQQAYTYLHESTYIGIKFSVSVETSNSDDGGFVEYEMRTNEKLKMDLFHTVKVLFVLSDEYPVYDRESPKWKEKKKNYYLRFLDDKKVEWQWYNNDKAMYDEYPDYEEEQKKGLLRKQLEAIFQANTSTNFLEHRSFNNCGITHLVNLLPKTDGVVAHYTMSSRSASGLITNMEQVNINSGYHRTIKRLRDGKNSLFDYWRKTNEFIEQWKTKYLLSSYQQQKYFWCHILAVAAKMQYASIEMENQLVTIAEVRSMSKGGTNQLFNEIDETEMLKEKRDMQLYPGFLIPPLHVWETIDLNKKDEDISLNAWVEKLSKTRVLTKIPINGKTRMNTTKNAKNHNNESVPLIPRYTHVSSAGTSVEVELAPQLSNLHEHKKDNSGGGNHNYNDEALLVDDTKDVAWIHTRRVLQYKENQAIMLRFCEMVRKFILEYENPDLGHILWPYYRNTFHKHNYQQYDNLVNKYNLGHLYNEKDVVVSLFDTYDYKHRETLCAHFGCHSVAEKKTFLNDPHLDQYRHIRHKRKFAAKMLLQQWDTRRNLNLLRAQLILLFEQLETKRNRANRRRRNKNQSEREEQKEIIAYAQTVEWKAEIKEVNKQYKTDLQNHKSTGWQVLLDGTLDNEQCLQVTTKLYPYFEWFIDHFLFSQLQYKESMKIKTTNATNANQLQNKSYYYEEFKNSWRQTPTWWDKSHDLVLLQFALQHNFDTAAYVSALSDDRSSEFILRLRRDTIADGPQRQSLSTADRSATKALKRLSVAYVHRTNSSRNLLAASYAGSADANLDDDDPLQPYQEFKLWCTHSANVEHRLKFVTTIMMKYLLPVYPSLFAIRVPLDSDIPTMSGHSLLFTDYERKTHISFLRQIHGLFGMTAADMKNINGPHTPMAGSDRTRKIKFDTEFKSDQNNNDTAGDGLTTRVSFVNEQEHAQKLVENPALKKKYQKFSNMLAVNRLAPESAGTGIGLLGLTKLLTGDDSDSDDSTSEVKTVIDNVLMTSYGKDVLMALPLLPSMSALQNERSVSAQRKINEIERFEEVRFRFRDPFLHRDIVTELREQIQMFDLIEYGHIMAKFIILQIKQKQRKSLWTALKLILEALPFRMGFEILQTYREILIHGTPHVLYDLCLHAVQSTDFKIAAALRMAEYFDSLASIDQIQTKIWMELSNKFEFIAHHEINEIESDHLVHTIMLTPLHDSERPMTLLQLALDQKRVSFLNNERIAGVLNHVWYYESFVSPLKEVHVEPMKYVDQLKMLIFQPFRFYLTPMGHHWTEGLMYIVYLVYILVYAYQRFVPFVDRASDLRFYMESILWLLNVGFWLHQLMQLIDNPRKFCSLQSGLLGKWDTLISIWWAVILALRIYIVNNPQFEDLGEEEPAIAAYTLLFAFQIFIVTIRLLVLFQTTPYIGVLLRIVSLMSKQFLKFASLSAIVMIACIFGLYFIEGYTGDSTETFFETVPYVFQMFIGAIEIKSDRTALAYIFSIWLMITGLLILTNLLIALMTTEYEDVQQRAQEEISFLSAQASFEISNRDRFYPPPFNTIIFVVASIIHVVTFIPTVVCKCCNVYALIDYRTYDKLHYAYCGCNRYTKDKMEKQKPSNNKKNEKDLLLAQSKAIYQNRCKTCKILSGWAYVESQWHGFTKNQWGHACQQALDICCCVSNVKRCFKFVFCCRGCCCGDESGNLEEVMYQSMDSFTRRNSHIPLQINASADNSNRDRRRRMKKQHNMYSLHHKGCLCVMKVDTSDGNSSKSTVRGITIKEYLERREDSQGTKLDIEDKILMKHLTVDTLFCDRCFKPFLEKHLDLVVFSPFRALCDILSCWLFLMLAWIPLILILNFLSIVETFGDWMTNDYQTSRLPKSERYAAFDREYRVVNSKVADPSDD